MKLRSKPCERRLKVLQDLSREGEAAVDVFPVPTTQEGHTSGKCQAATLLRMNRAEYSVAERSGAVHRK